MSKPRRTKPLHGNGSAALTPLPPDLPVTRPDLRAERILYTLLLREQRKNESLRKALARARERLIEWKARGKVRHIAKGLKPSQHEKGQE